MAFKITLDPGHGKFGNPAKVDGEWIVKDFYEGTNNFEACTYFKEYIEKKYKDVEVTLTRKNIDDDPSLETRGAMGREADLFYSWHSNGVDTKAARGVSSFSSVRRDGKKLCTAIAEAVVAVFKECGSRNTYNRGYSQRKDEDYPDVDWYGVLRSATLLNPTPVLYGAKPIDSKCKNAIIIEHGFHSNPEECAVLANPVYLKKIVEAEVKAIAVYFGLKEKDPSPEPPAPDDYYYYVVVSANKNKKYAEEDLAKVKKANKGFPEAYIKYAKR